MAEQRYDRPGLGMMPVKWSAESVTLSGGVQVPQSFEVLLEHPDWPTSAVLSVVVDPDSGPVASGIRGSGQPPIPFRDVMAMVSSTADVDELLWDAMASATGWRAEGRVRDLHPGGTMLTDEARAASLTALRETVAMVRQAPRLQRRRRLTRGFLREVADVYTKAHAAGEPPTMAVAEHFTVSHRTATRWAREARAAGELGPLDDGQEAES